MCVCSGIITPGSSGSLPGPKDVSVIFMKLSRPFGECAHKKCARRGTSLALVAISAFFKRCCKALLSSALYSPKYAPEKQDLKKKQKQSNSKDRHVNEQHMFPPLAIEIALKQQQPARAKPSCAGSGAIWLRFLTFSQVRLQKREKSLHDTYLLFSLPHSAPFPHQPTSSCREMFGAYRASPDSALACYLTAACQGLLGPAPTLT